MGRLEVAVQTTPYRDQIASEIPCLNKKEPSPEWKNDDGSRLRLPVAVLRRGKAYHQPEAERTIKSDRSQARSAKIVVLRSADYNSRNRDKPKEAVHGDNGMSVDGFLLPTKARLTAFPFDSKLRAMTQEPELIYSAIETCPRCDGPGVLKEPSQWMYEGVLEHVEGCDICFSKTEGLCDVAMSLRTPENARPQYYCQRCMLTFGFESNGVITGYWTIGSKCK